MTVDVKSVPSISVTYAQNGGSTRANALFIAAHAQVTLSRQGRR
jgi:hypothetical protein